jgi:Ca2+-binding RTX toxin-like protein
MQASFALNDFEGPDPTFTGPGFVEVFPEFSGNTDWVIVGVGDLNADARADIVWRNELDGRIGGWITSDIGVFPDPFGLRVGAESVIGAPPGWTDPLQWQVADVNDYDADGKADLLLRNSDGANAIWKLDGLTVVSSSVIAGAPAKGAEWAVTGSLAADVSTGDALPNRQTGDSGAEVMRGLAGADRLEGRGGNDTLLGGTGNDVLQVSDVSFNEIDGGPGTDTFALAGANQTLDLTLLANDEVLGIEKIDLTGSGNNTLRIGQLDVMDLSDTTNQLIVDGNSGDATNLVGAWADGGLSGGYRTYTLGGATMLVNTAVIVSFS